MLDLTGITNENEFYTHHYLSAILYEGGIRTPYSALSGSRKNSRKSKEEREINKVFSQYLDWIEETMTTKKHAWVQVVAVLTEELL